MWYVQYDAKTRELNREGPDPHASESGYTTLIFKAAPVQWDAITGKRLLEWSPAVLNYIHPVA